MLQVIDSKNTTRVSSKAKATTVGVLGVFWLGVVVPIGLKLAGYTSVATWPWVKVTALLWIPWVLLGVISAIGWVVHGLKRPLR